MLIKKYDYEHYDRETKKTGRSYLVGKKKLPSVTTILDKTKDKEWLKKSVYFKRIILYLNVK